MNNTQLKALQRILDKKRRELVRRHHLSSYPSELKLPPEVAKAKKVYDDYFEQISKYNREVDEKVNNAIDSIEMKALMVSCELDVEKLLKQLDEIKLPAPPIS